MNPQSICGNYSVISDLEEAVSELQQDPNFTLDSLVVVEECPDYKGELVWQPICNEQRFYERYKDWLSRFLILSQPFMLNEFARQLESDGYTVLFTESCREILEGYERWLAPLAIENFTAPGGGELYPYQQFSLNRALERATAQQPHDRLYFVGWAAGAGKTLFACAGAQELVNRGQVDVILFFTLMKLKINMARSIKTTTNLSVIVNDGSAAKRKKEYEKGFQVYVLNFDKSWADFDDLMTLVEGKRTLFILDEGHKVLTDAGQNRCRKSLDKLISASSPIVWPMSATVVNNSPFKYRDVFSIGGFRWNPLGTKTDFEKQYVKSKKEYKIQTKNGGCFRQTYYDWDLPKLHDVRHRVADRCHNVRKTDVGVRDSFKGMQTVVVPVQLSSEDRSLYDVVCEKAREAVEKEESLAPYYRLLRYICNTPESLAHTKDEFGQEITANYPRLVTSKNCAKLEMLLDQIEAIQEAGDKVVVFCQWTHLGVLLLRKHLDDRKIRHVVHYGVGQSEKESHQAQNEFKTNPDITVFLSSDAGSHGLSFQEARFVINYDVPYSYDMLVQRSERINRADSYLDGLTSYVYVTEDTVEERIWGILNDRRELAEATLGTKEVLSYGSENSREGLSYLIFGDKS